MKGSSSWPATHHQRWGVTGLPEVYPKGPVTEAALLSPTSAMFCPGLAFAPA
eukprot:CAMPEP_0183474974 /NCGR_PEP_ID=MMETSP0370-20130417/163998_1 /TAXON_ID=268820 /ORGANISM="Peridinium aciculiferum, Strain PAER-2" /LENGTH=51 /DNA_ID=CAMNT_0025667745 /DNA_START=344 /DNA_END=499 /DNA_ORIENTATION=-